MCKKQYKNWQAKLHEIIYEADTPEGKLFDVILLITIIASILLVMLESVESIDFKYHEYLNIGEWIITIFFSIEYILRIISIKKPLKYVFSFYGIAPQTPLGQLIASVIMILGYAVIAIPTGIVSSELTKSTLNEDVNTQSCPNCLKEKHKDNAIYCYNCGSVLNP